LFFYKKSTNFVPEKLGRGVGNPSFLFCITHSDQKVIEEGEVLVF